MKIYKVQTPLWWRTRLLNHVRCKKNKKPYGIVKKERRLDCLYNCYSLVNMMLLNGESLVRLFQSQNDWDFIGSLN